MNQIAKLDDFTRAYLTCALWASTDESTEAGGEPLDVNYTIADLSPDTFAQAVKDCTEFQATLAPELEQVYGQEGPYSKGRVCSPESAGHDFWLTRNGHGAGFWDGDYPEPEGATLTEASQAFGGVDLYVGDDGQIHGSTDTVSQGADECTECGRRFDASPADKWPVCRACK